MPVSDQVSLKVTTFIPKGKSDNPAVFFVPGWVSLVESWKDVLLEMTRDFKIYYVESREKISSHVNGKVEYGVEAISNDIAVLAETFDLQAHNYILFGSSLGATAILESCRDLSVVPKCLVLVAPNALFRVPKTWVGIVRCFYPPAYSLLKPSVKWYLKNFRMGVDEDPAQYSKYSQALDEADPWKLRKGVLDLYKYEVWDILPDIEYPALIIGASKDSLHEPENLQRMVREMKNAKYLDMETNKKSHTAEVVHEIRSYLKELAG